MDAEQAGLNFQSSPALRQFLRNVSTTDSISEKLRTASLKYAEDESVVPFTFLREAYGSLGKEERSPIHLILAGSSFHLESPKAREKSAELKERLEKLQRLVEEKQYGELVHDITKHNVEPEAFSSFKDQLGFGLHVALTMFTGFACGFTIFKSLFRETPVLHAAGGALGLIVGMLVETLLFIVRDVQREKFDGVQKKEREKSSRASSKKEL